MQSPAASLDDRRHFRQVCQLAREAFAANPEDLWADVKEAIKCRCARLRLGYEDIDRAMAAVVSSTPYRGPVQSDAAPIADHHGFSHQEAAALLEKITAWRPGPVASATAVRIAGTGPRGSVDAPGSGAAGGSRVPRCGDD